MTKYGTPPNFFTWKFFYQNDSEWPKMDFKHNFEKFNHVSAPPSPPIVTFVTFFLTLPLYLIPLLTLFDVKYAKVIMIAREEKRATRGRTYVEKFAVKRLNAMVTIWPVTLMSNFACQVI